MLLVIAGLPGLCMSYAESDGRDPNDVPIQEPVEPTARPRFDMRAYLGLIESWKSENSYPEFPELVESNEGILIPERVNFIDDRPPLYHPENPMIGSAPFVVRVLTENEKQRLIRASQTALQEHFDDRPERQNMGFESAPVSDYEALSILEVYSFGRLFGPTSPDGVTFVLVMKDDLKDRYLYEGDAYHSEPMPWGPGGIHFLVIERSPDGVYHVTREGAAG